MNVLNKKEVCMKKIFSILLIHFCFEVFIFSASINSKIGYKELPWGSSVDDAKKAGYKLTNMSSLSDKEYLKKLYNVDVDAYDVISKDKKVTALQFHYYNGKLFSVTETLSMTELDLGKLENRYGNLKKQEIYLVGNQYMDAKLDVDGTISRLSIIISKTTTGISTVLYDWETYRKISFVGQKLSKTEQKTIIEELNPLANKLVQEKKGSLKPSYAFMALTTDYKNTLVDNYVTDALTEAMFNTGKIKIIERANLETILEEQKFQSSGLVNEETVKSIGMIAGVDFVCYGTLKDVGDSFTVNARVVDVETGELCAISRATVMKDDYLKKQPQTAVGIAKTTVVTTKKTTTATQNKTTTLVEKNAWKVTEYYDEFGGFRHYVFTVNSTDEKMLFVSYRKCENSANSKVVSGIHWTSSDNWNYSHRGTYEIKGKTGETVTKKFNQWAFKCFLDKSEKRSFYYMTDPTASARWLVDIIRKSDSVAVRRDGLIRRFQTDGLLDKMAEYGITWEEIDTAIANEEF